MKAFPIKGWNGYEQTIHEGMDLRDYFAAKAMQGMLTNQPIRNDVMLHGDSLAKACYQVADAMMKAREK